MAPIADLVYNADIARRPDCCTGSTSITTTETTTSNCNTPVYFVPPPPPKTECVPYPYGWIVPPGYPCPPSPEDQITIKQNATEKKICKLSRTAATLRSLIENISEKNKPVIIKSAAVSYNLGSFKTKDPDDLDTDIEDENIDTLVSILKSRLEEVKEEIKTLSDELITD